MAQTFMLDGVLTDWRMAALALGALCCVASVAATRATLVLLRRWQVMDVPNERSSHTLPTPRGGGWGVAATMLPAWAAIAIWSDDWARLGPILSGCVGLIAISWFDDRGGLGAGPRFLAQILAVAAGLSALPADGLVFQAVLPFWADRLVAAVGWLWFVNLFNFMDGIDGIAGGEAMSVGAGIALIAGLTGAGGPALPLYAAAVAGAALGFLAWNWHPAKVFMGDVGSVPLGYALGFLLLTLAASGFWLSALLLPAYFLADATITLLRRAARLEKIWRAHREHFYQKAAQRGFTHAQASGWVLALNVALIGLSWLSLQPFGWLAAPGGAAAVAFVLLIFARGRENPR